MPRKITVIMPYYLNAGMLRRQLLYYDNLSAFMWTCVSVIIVDDGSPKNPASVPSKLRNPHLDLRIFRVDKDIRWNQDAARNIGVKEAKTDWIILTDIDHIVSEAALDVAVNGTLQRGAAYRFGRVTALDVDAAIEPYKPHPNSFLMEKYIFDRAGGYDERFAGYYGTDADFVERLQKVAPILQLEQPLIRYPRELIADASTTTYQRKTEEDGINIRRIKRERKALGEWQTVRYRNAWRQVYP